MGEFEQRASTAGGGPGCKQECMMTSFYISEGGGINDVFMRSWYKDT